MVAVLTPKSGGKSIVIDKAVVLVGRHPDCDYILQNSRKVSRRHVCLVQVNEKYVVRDLGSMNGVTVNGKRVEKEQRITIGDEIVIGDVLFRFEEVQRIPRPPRKQPVPVAPPPPVAEPPPEKPPNGAGLVSSPLPSDISQQYPVAIPDEDQSFAVSGGPVEDEAKPVMLPSPQIADDDEVGFINLDEPLATGNRPIDRMEELDVVDTIDEAPELGDSFGEFGPVIDVVEDFGDDEIEDVIVLDDPEVLDDDDDMILE